MSTSTRADHSAAIYWVIGTSLLTAAVGFLALQLPMLYALALVAFVVVALLLVVKPTWWPSVAYALGVLLILTASTTAVSEASNSSILSVASRTMGLSILIVLGATRPSVLGRPRLPLRELSWVGYLALGLGTYLVVGAGLHGQALSLTLYGFGLVLLVTAAVVLGRANDPALGSGILIALVSLMVASLALGAVAPASGLEMGRLRGVLENANSLGFFAFLLGAIALVHMRRPAASVLALTLAAVVVIWTGSRASALALVITALVLLVGRGVLRSVVILVGSLSIVALAWIVDLNLFEPLSGLLRLNDSRSASTATALAAFDGSKLIGIGIGDEEAIIASSPLRALAQAGVFGISAVIVMWATFLIRGLRTGKGPFAVALAASIHSVFEGWLLSPVSPLLSIFVVAWVVMERDVRQGVPEGTIDIHRASRRELHVA